MRCSSSCSAKVSINFLNANYFAGETPCQRAYRPKRWTHMRVLSHFCSYRPKVWTLMHAPYPPGNARTAPESAQSRRVRPCCRRRIRRGRESDSIIFGFNGYSDELTVISGSSRAIDNSLWNGASDSGSREFRGSGIRADLP